MLRLSRRTLYTLEAVLDIAWHGAEGPVRNAEISARQAIPRRYLEPVLQALVRDGVLHGQRGPRGGYRLACAAADLSLARIFRLVDELDAQSEEASPTLSSPLGQTVVAPLCQDATRALDETLGRLTVQDLIDRAHAAGLTRPGLSALDFTI